MPGGATACAAWGLAILAVAAATSGPLEGAEERDLPAGLGAARALQAGPQSDTATTETMTLTSTTETSTTTLLTQTDTSTTTLVETTATTVSTTQTSTITLTSATGAGEDTDEEVPGTVVLTSTASAEDTNEGVPGTAVLTSTASAEEEVPGAAVTTSSAAGVHEVSGAVRLEVSNADQFVGDAQVQAALQEGLASFASVPTSYVAHTLSLERRRLSVSPRRLTAGSVRWDYTISVPSSAVGSGSPSAIGVHGTMAGASLEDLEELVAEAAAAVSAAGGSAYTTRVLGHAVTSTAPSGEEASPTASPTAAPTAASTASPTASPTPMPTPAPTMPPTVQEAQSATESDGGEAVGGLVAGLVVFFALCALCCVCVLYRHRIGRALGGSAARKGAQADGSPLTSDRADVKDGPGEDNNQPVSPARPRDRAEDGSPAERISSTSSSPTPSSIGRTVIIDDDRVSENNNSEVGSSQRNSSTRISLGETGGRIARISLGEATV